MAQSSAAAGEPGLRCTSCRLDVRKSALLFGFSAYEATRDGHGPGALAQQAAPASVETNRSGRRWPSDGIEVLWRAVDRAECNLARMRALPAGAVAFPST